jgi:hypothetical protein
MNSNSESSSEIPGHKFDLSVEDLMSVLKSNRRGTKRKSLHITGNYIQLFQKKLAIFEKNVKIISTNAVFYPGKRKANSIFFRINATCSSCWKSAKKRTYTFTIDENPFKVTLLHLVFEVQDEITFIFCRKLTFKTMKNFALK